MLSLLNPLYIAYGRIIEAVPKIFLASWLAARCRCFERVGFNDAILGCRVDIVSPYQDIGGSHAREAAAGDASNSASVSDWDAATSISVIIVAAVH